MLVNPQVNDIVKSMFNKRNTYRITRVYECGKLIDVKCVQDSRIVYKSQKIDAFKI